MILLILLLMEQNLVKQGQSILITTKIIPKLLQKKTLFEKDSLDERCITAYNYFRNNKYLIDREYVYYGLSPNNKENGKLDPNIREKLYKFRVDPQKYGAITNEQIGEDPHLKNEADYKKDILQANK